MPWRSVPGRGLDELASTPRFAPRGFCVLGWAVTRFESQANFGFLISKGCRASAAACQFLLCYRPVEGRPRTVLSPHSLQMSKLSRGSLPVILPRHNRTCTGAPRRSPWTSLHPFHDLALDPSHG